MASSLVSHAAGPQPVPTQQQGYGQPIVTQPGYGQPVYTQQPGQPQVVYVVTDYGAAGGPYGTGYATPQGVVVYPAEDNNRTQSALSAIGCLLGCCCCCACLCLPFIFIRPARYY